MTGVQIIADKRRRQRPRLRVGIPARLETLREVVDVQLLDLSQTGARLQRGSCSPGRSGILRWLDFEAYGDVIWDENQLLGVKFDPALPPETILATRELAPSVGQEFDPIRDAAKAWSMGHLR